jgi:hypothetical protein
MRRYPADEVLLYFVVRIVAYFNPRPADERPPGDIVEWALRRDAPLVGLPDATKADLSRIWESKLARPFDPAAATTEWHNPFKEDLITQRISREDNAIREPFMAEQLLLAAKPGARVFGVFGEGHVCNLEPLLRDGSKK